MRPFYKKEPSIKYSASTQGTARLSRNYHLDHLIIKLKVNMTNSTAVLKNGTLLDLFNKIELVSNGSNYHKVLNPIGINVTQIVNYKTLGKRSVDLTDGAKDNYAYFRIDFSLSEMKKNFDTIENVALFDTFDLNVDWGDASSLGTGIVVNSASLEISSVHAIGYKRPKGTKILRNIESNASYEITGANDQFKIDLTTEQYYDKLFVCATADGAMSDTVVKNIILKSGETVIYNFDAEALQADNITEYEPKVQTDLKGVYILDFTKLRRSLDDVLDTHSVSSNFKTLDLVLDVEKQGTLCKAHVFRKTITDTGLVEG